MLPEPIELKLGTSAENSISWSADGQIAIAAGERIHVLQPNHGDDCIQKPWHKLHFRVDIFSDEEWPPQTVPRTTDGLFIGREQAAPEVSALAWSSPGLAKHDRCALAVLMTNGFLAVWVPGTDPHSPSGWAKRLSVNLVIAEQSGHEDKDHRDNIRAFSWKPDVTNGQEQHLAVVNEKGDLAILEVSRKGLGLHGQVMGVRVSESSHRALKLRDLISSSHRGFLIRWHESSQANSNHFDGLEEFATIHFISHGTLETIKLSYASADDKKSISFQTHEKNVPAHGPIDLAGGRISYLWQNQLQCLNTSSLVEAENLNRQEESVPLGSIPGWDLPVLLAGLGSPKSRDEPKRSLPTLLPVGFLDIFHMVSPEARRMRGGAKAIETADVTRSYLAKAVQDGIEAFSSEHSLDNKVFARFHGLATFGADEEFIALLVTYWPREQIVYQIKAYDRTHMIFSHRDLEYSGKDVNRENLRFPWQQKQHSVEESNNFPNILSTIYEPGIELASEYQPLAFLQLCGSIVRKDVEGTKVAFEILESLNKGAWYRQISDTTQIAMAQETDNPLEIANALIESSAHFGEDLVERCSMSGCSQPLYFENDEHRCDTATCARFGHTYARCSLTLFAIQQPFISKRCESCSRTFFDEEKLEAKMAPLVSILSTYKHCPFCGGKFTG